MRTVIQRVQEAEVWVESSVVGKIGKGMVLLVGAEEGDTEQDAEYLASKLIDLRIFDDSRGKMNLSLRDVRGQLLAVSQFTLLADCAKGRRPSFDKAASAEEAERLYQYLIARLKESGLRVESGKFGGRMKVHLINDGPVTMVLDSRRKSNEAQTYGAKRL